MPRLIGSRIGINQYVNSAVQSCSHNIFVCKELKVLKVCLWQNWHKQDYFQSEHLALSSIPLSLSLILKAKWLKLLVTMLAIRNQCLVIWVCEGWRYCEKTGLRPFIAQNICGSEDKDGSNWKYGFSPFELKHRSKYWCTRTGLSHRWNDWKLGAQSL